MVRGSCRKDSPPRLLTPARDQAAGLSSARGLRPPGPPSTPPTHTRSRGVASQVRGKTRHGPHPPLPLPFACSTAHPLPDSPAVPGAGRIAPPAPALACHLRQGASWVRHGRVHHDSGGSGSQLLLQVLLQLIARQRSIAEVDEEHHQDEEGDRSAHHGVELGVVIRGEGLLLQ